MSQSFEDEIAALTQRVQSDPELLNPESRIKALKAARDLIHAITPPPETAIQDVVLSPVLLMAIRVGVDLDVFQAICDGQGEGVTTDTIAEKTGASFLLVALSFDRNYGKPSFSAMTRACFDIGNYTTTCAPEYFRQNKHAFFSSPTETPFQLAKGTSLDYFAWLAENPLLATDFQAWMTVKQQASPSWVDWFDVEGLILDGFQEHNAQGSSSSDGETEGEQAEPVLIVDIGGGQGHYLHAFNRRFPHAPGQRILQDLPHTIDAVSDIPDKTKLMAYDFFTAQPVKGARTYYLHWILHDWADPQARTILSNISAAMKPGYSRLVINESIDPDKGCDFATACISAMMMLQVGARERTEGQWRKLLPEVGLTEVRCYQSPAGSAGEGIIFVTK
ncbi:S-adenosyl-L-methionine-dependent methyltransferase [Aspergillus saccharolyticus JOP 1030-1]|uniref:S-adenosyl-L-methionine-dependent methyltransferase n=1 Tax=Aspergillus saccharolyticus JOP 1030-1 TaxID=1450539 RepID=A0A318ZUM2_9EURO|nr:S-adenosyl-L-methionine-dependent methyltransferase [Aspergillus saccharolyticus JOP 1030-1]PYH48043.1 S-adenosyl-L-methionine-dependent methyltransferase [Aspergillus saccharolyticus JOP 1030-1]